MMGGYSNETAKSGAKINTFDIVVIPVETYFHSCLITIDFKKKKKCPYDPFASKRKNDKEKYEEKKPQKKK